MFCFFAAKGGVGCSVAAASVAVLSSLQRPTLLVDLHGDQAEILGVATNDEGLDHWFRADAAPPDALHRMEVDVTSSLSLLPRGSVRSLARPDRYRVLASILAADDRAVIVDVGTWSIPAVALLGDAERSVLVTRACYLALRSAGCGPRPDDVILIHEPGRALQRRDVEAAVGAPVTVQVPWDQSVARAVDAGLLAARLPRSLRPLQALL